MKRSFPSLIALVILSSSVSAQWAAHQTNVPRNRDGRPNLAASAPRTPEGKPDLSGVWMIKTDEPDSGTLPPGRPPQIRGGYAGAGFKGGLPFQPWAAELQKKRAAEGGLNDPDGLCMPQGPLQYHVDPQPLKVVQTPTQILIIYESNYGFRTIYLDGRKLPAVGEPQPFWHGYSVGRWEGDTLVVESNNFKGVDPARFRGVEPADFHGVGWLDHRGSPYTEAMKLTERFRRASYGRMEIDVTVDDPKAYSRPFTVRVNQQIVPDGSELIEFICHENQMFLKLTGRAPK